MRLTCPNCSARYEVDDSMIPPEGRDVQCSNCSTTWFQPGRRPLPPPASEMPGPGPRGPMEAAESANAHGAPDGAEDSVAPAPEDPAEATPDTEPDESIFTDPPGEDAPPPEPPAEAAQAGEDTPGDETFISDEVAAAAADAADPDAESAEESASVMPRPVRPTRRDIDPQVRDILREEAEREARLRRGQADPVETQAEMALDPSAPAEPARRDALEGAEDAYAAMAAGGAAGTRRELLPDIEEINSTLRATGDRRGEEPDASDIDTVVHAAARRRGVRLGFVLVLALAALGAWVYSDPAAIVRTVPAAEPFVAQFVALVDTARFWLDDMAQRLAERT